MKFLVIMSLFLIRQAYAWQEVRCYNGQVVITAMKKNQYHIDAKIRFQDPVLAQIAGANEISGYAYNAYGGDSFDHAIFRFELNPKDPKGLMKVIYLGVNNSSLGDLSIYKEGKTECLRYEENCACCYYGDCSPVCLEERVIPAVHYLNQKITCEII